jgi:MFS family permease
MGKKLEANILKFILFNIFSTFVLYYGIDKVLMEARGLSTTDIVFLEIFCAVLILFLEVPSGAISDKWSRKYVLALNVAFFMLTTFFWVIAQDINLFILGATTGAIHMALRSGTDTSFLYDTLYELGRTDECMQQYSSPPCNNNFRQSVTEFFATP